MSAASDIIEYERSQIGYQEKSRLGSREQMWIKNWSPGYANYTIWAILYSERRGQNFQGQPWCAVFQSMCFAEVYGVEVAKELLGGDFYYNCQDFATKHYSELKDIPRPGAIELFFNGVKYHHTGLCSAYDEDTGTFSSIEGNTSASVGVVPDGGCVTEKHYRLGSTKVKFFYPAYTGSDKVSTESVNIEVGQKGLEATGFINARSGPGTTYKALKVLRPGTRIKPDIKAFEGGNPWFCYNEDNTSYWVSGKHLEGWILEKNGRWWYVTKGYNYSVNAWQKIDGEWYYFDNTGYMAVSQWILGKDGLYYYVTKDGVMAKDAYIKSTQSDMYYWVDKNGIWQTDMDTTEPRSTALVLI